MKSVKTTLSRRARQSAPATTPQKAASGMIESTDLPADTMDHRLKLLKVPSNLKALNAAALAGQETVELSTAGEKADQDDGATVVEVLLELSDFEEYVERPAPDTATATALRSAVKAGEDDQAIAKVAAQNPEDHAKNQESVLLAKRMDKAIRHRGKTYPPGHWFVKRKSGTEVVSDKDFGSRFISKQAARPTKKERAQSTA